MLVKFFISLIILFSSFDLYAIADENNSSNFSHTFAKIYEESEVKPQDRNPLNKDFLSGFDYSNLTTNAVNQLNFNLKKLLQKNGQKNTRVFKIFLLHSEMLSKEISTYLFKRYSSGIYQSSWDDFIL